jgi:hypothetical protein
MHLYDETTTLKGRAIEPFDGSERISFMLKFDETESVQY